MVWLPSIPSDLDLPSGCRRLTGTSSGARGTALFNCWQSPELSTPDCLLVLASTRSAEVQGISAAGCTPAARRTTALADAELLIHGPGVPPRWPLPPLPAGVSPALISRVVAETIPLNLQVAALGLPIEPPFPHLRFEAPFHGPAHCLSGGAAMDPERAGQLIQRGKWLGRRLRRPLVLAECVPGGTTTALAVLTGLGLPVAQLVSGSALHPPMELKQALVAEGLSAIQPVPTDPEVLLAAVGDPFQALTMGVLLGAVESDQPILLAGGSQMVAVLALALAALPPVQRQRLCNKVMLGTTAWLAAESLESAIGPSSLEALLLRLEHHFGVALEAYAAGLRFFNSRHQQLRDFESGHVKEGVGAGGLALLAALRGVDHGTLLQGCDDAMDRLLQATGLRPPAP